MDKSGEADEDKQTPFSNDRVLVPDPEPNLEPFHVFQRQEKRCSGTEKKPLSNLNLLNSKLLTDNIREQRAGQSPHQVMFLKQQLLNKTRSNKSLPFSFTKLFLLEMPTAMCI